jgi:Pentapeptide repeats (8 copies)
MAHHPHCRILAIIGSGETSPTMVTVHRDLVSRLGLSSPRAILLATPYAFQENAADVSARAERYFAESVGLRVRVAAGTSPHADPRMAPPLTGADLTGADLTGTDLTGADLTGTDLTGTGENEGRQAADIAGAA